MYLDIDGHTVYECLCETCYKIEHIPEEQVTFDLIELGRLYGKEGGNGNSNRTNPAKSASRT